MKTQTIEILFVNDQEEVLHSLDYFDTVKEAKARVKATLENPKMTLDDSAEVKDWHKQVYQIQLKVNGEWHSGWYPKFYVEGAVTTPYARC